MLMGQEDFAFLKDNTPAANVGMGSAAVIFANIYLGGII